LRRHKKPGSPDSLKLEAVLCGKSGKFADKASNFYCFDHQNTWVRAKSRTDFAELVDLKEPIPDNDAVNWALERFEDDGLLCDVTHVELVTENGYRKIKKLISAI